MAGQPHLLTSTKRVAWATPRDPLNIIFRLTDIISMNYETIIQYDCHLVVYALLALTTNLRTYFRNCRIWRIEILRRMIRDTCCRARQLRGTARSRIERLQISYLHVCIAVRCREQPIEPFNYCSKLLQIQFNRRLILKTGSMDMAHWGLAELWWVDSVFRGSDPINSNIVLEH
jgi:hypothetical protein